MWDLKIFGLEFYNLFYFFFIYCFVGWIMESVYVSIENWKLVNRGFMNGPVIPLYGCGGVLVYLLFYNPVMAVIADEPSFAHYAVIFVIGMAAATVLEYVTSFLMERLFHAKWWDYSRIPLNLNGRVCLSVSLCWGALSIVFVRILHPAVERLIGLIPRMAGEVAGILFMVLFLSDLAITVAVTIQLDKKINSLYRLREELYEFVYNLKIYETKEEIKGKISQMRMVELLAQGKQWCQDVLAARPAELENEAERRGFRSSITEHVGEVEEKVKDLFSKYKATTVDFLQRFVFQRMFRAFPTMRVKGREEAFADLKERLSGDGEKNSREEGK